MITEQQLLDAGYIRLVGRYGVVDNRLTGPNPVTSMLVCPYCGSSAISDRSYDEFTTYQCGVIISRFNRVMVITSKTSACDVLTETCIEDDVI